jgi:hypothetical protein
MWMRFGIDGAKWWDWHVRKQKDKYVSFDHFLVAADEAKVAGQACRKKKNQFLSSLLPEINQAGLTCQEISQTDDKLARPNSSQRQMHLGVCVKKNASRGMEQMTSPNLVNIHPNSPNLVARS